MGHVLLFTAQLLFLNWVDYFKSWVESTVLCLSLSMAHKKRSSAVDIMWRFKRNPIFSFSILSQNLSCLKLRKELSFRHKLKYSNSYIFATWWCKPLIFQTYNISSNIIYSLKYQRFMTSGCKDIRIKNLSLWQKLNSFGGKLNKKAVYLHPAFLPILIPWM